MRRTHVLALLWLGATACSVLAWTGDPLLDDHAFLPAHWRYPGTDGFDPPTRWQPLVHLSFHTVGSMFRRSLGPAALAHHLISLGLHLASITLLFALLAKRHPARSVHPWHAFVLGAFALHPSLIEAYGHLAGRGEAFALACLAGVALGVELGLARLCVALTVLGMAASPTVAPAALALAIAGRLESPERIPRWLPAWIAGVAGALAALTFGVPVHLVDLARWSVRAPHAIAIATRALIVPTETALRLPHWELSRAMRPIDGLFALVPWLFALARWSRGARGSAVRVIGAALSVLPMVHRADTMSFGLDRYLAGAAVLATVTALCEPPPEWIASLRTSSRVVVSAAGMAMLAVLGFMTWQTAHGFASDTHQLDAMTQMRGRDPSGHLRNAWFAARTGDRANAAGSLDRAMHLPLTPEMATRARVIARALQRR